ncbi:probable ATP-dependent RNA helicase ddx56 isoform X1 [Macrobrachium nipponense]|uniref:probable ATP-dependent RNA helicase ddx56 isoform X1 n=1 Tax=Macrobrachium nipponense TaxID=159736 RepID=UPI0030C7EEA6
MEFATTAEDISFGLKCHLKFDSEEKALEMESTAAEVEFTDNKAAVNNAFREYLKKAEKRSLNSDDESPSSKKKRDSDENGGDTEEMEENAIGDLEEENEEPQECNENDDDDGDDDV